MPQLIIRQNREETALVCETGLTLAQALERDHREIEQPCAGRGRCGKCRVRAGGALSAPSEEETRLLGEENLQAGMRLACLARVEGDAWIAPLKTGGLSAIAVEGSQASFPFAPLPGVYGAAVDIGTTTVVAFLYRLADGARLCHAAAKNPQAAWGADVISRMEQALAGHGEALRASITGCLNGLLSTLAERSGIAREDIDSFVVTGNTTMLYLLTGRDPECLSHAPFEADERFGAFYPASSLGIAAGPQAQVYLPRCMAAFVGADITTAIVASGMTKREKPCLLVDIGTNGELALWTGTTLTCCSTAAGPALEGVNISCGMAALPGAVDTVSAVDGRLSYTVLGGAAPRGVCGSGLIDAAAALLELGLLEDTGFLEEDCLLAPGVALTQQDIRSLQLAKGAICAGILTLLETAGLSPDEISVLYLAGGFGSYINLKSAAAIGLIPRELASKTQVLGNAAGAGASMLLQSRPLLEEAYALAESAKAVELSSNPVFSAHYMNCMLFDSEG